MIGLKERTLVALLAAVFFCGQAESTPLQWEHIKPVGTSPFARHSHAAVSLQSQQGMLFLFGGHGYSGVPPNNNQMDVWMLDSAAQGWEKVEFERTSDLENPGFIYADESCATVTINALMPSNRAGHVAVSLGARALICGGYTSKAPEATVFAGNGNELDCWWFTPAPYPRFDPLKVTAESAKPATRWGHSIAQDPKLGHMLLFGGMTKFNTALNDCWVLLVLPNAQDLDPTAQYDWVSCSPISPTALHPIKRYGAGAIFHSSSKSFYIFGGFAWMGANFAAMNDMWLLRDYTDLSQVTWLQVHSVSDQPVSRGFHATWLVGFNLFIHGGEGPSGLGIASVRSDTWSYDIFTLVWTRYGSSDASPAASMLSVTPLSESTAVSFGGMGKDSTPTDNCVFFDVKGVWTESDPAGTMPPRSAGHAAIYDPDSYQMIISFGMEAGPKLLDDQWILNLVTMVWICSEGSSRQCLADKRLRGVMTTGVSLVRPSHRAFSTGYKVGLYKFIFGGLVPHKRVCVSGVSKDDFIGTDEMWAMNIASRSWFKVEQGAVKPAARAFSQMAGLQDLGGFLNPIMLIGGANMSCTLENPPCEVPQPMNDVWVTDGTPKPSSTTDQMCELDGQDDIVGITLPPWCKQVSSMSVLWLDMWVQPKALGNIKMILVEAYNGLTPMLRWYLQGDEGNFYLVLVLTPGKSQVQVKKWGPLPQNTVGFWHHFCFTLRFARFYSSSSSDPKVGIAQAFMFIDGKAVQEFSSLFLTIDIKNKLTFSSGLSKIYLGGPSPSVAAPGFLLFKGSIDNVRIWWPSCAPATDPSKCNPFAFLYPQLKSGARQPTSGIQDAHVQMEHVAKPVLDYMFDGQVEEGESKGLLVAVSFDSDISDGVVRSDVDDTLVPSVCAVSPLGESCAGCPNSKCVFASCSEFDLECINVNNIEHYASEGSCQCRDVENCPTTVQACQCPQGLFRICESCVANFGVDATTGAICNSRGNNSACLEMAPFGCPALLCEQWGCSCFNPLTFHGTLDQSISADKNTGIAICRVNADEKASCPKGDVVEDESRCCQEVRGQRVEAICKNWGAVACDYHKGEITSCTGNCTELVTKASDPQSPFECGLSSCCLDGDTNDFGPGDGGGDEGQDTEELVTCTAEYTLGQIALSCSLAVNADEGTFLDGTFVVGEAVPETPSMPGTRSSPSLPHSKLPSVQILSQKLEKQEDDGPDTTVHVIRSKQISQILLALAAKDSSTAENNHKVPNLKPKSLDSLQKSIEGQNKNNLNGQNTRRLLQTPVQDTDYDGGYTLFTIEVQFSTCAGGTCDKFEEFFWKCDDSLRRGQDSVEACPDIIGAGDYSTYLFQDTLIAALETEFADYVFTVEDLKHLRDHYVQEFLEMQVYLVTFKVTGPTDDDTGLFAGFSLAFFTGSVKQSISEASCCGVVEISGQNRRRLLQNAPAPGEDTTTTTFSCNAAACGNASSTEDIVGKMSLATLGNSNLGFSPFVCGDGVIGIVEGDFEECDQGYEYNHPYGSCHDGRSLADNTYNPNELCQCNRANGFTLVGTDCLCSQRPRPTVFTASESSALMGAYNEITLRVTFQDEVQVVNKEGNVEPMVIEIVGLTGSQTVSTEALPITCSVSGWDHCTHALGVSVTKTVMAGDDSTATAWEWGKGDWKQETGTLKFTVTKNLAKTQNILNQGPPEPPTLVVTFTLKNSATAQTAVTPVVRICGLTSWDAEDEYRGFDGYSVTGYSGDPLLGCNAQLFGADSDCSAGCSMKKINAATGESENIATITFETPPSAAMMVSLQEAVLGRGVDELMIRALPAPGNKVTLPCNFATAQDPNPTCSLFAGAVQSVLQIDLATGGDVAATLKVKIDAAIVKKRGGCYTPESKSMTICLAGYIGLYKFNRTSQMWETEEAPTGASSTAAITADFVEKRNVTSSSTWAPLATSPCCDFAGTGTACGDKICLQGAVTSPMPNPPLDPIKLTPQSDDIFPAAKVVLGDGTLSKMPAVRATERPQFMTTADIEASTAFGAEPKSMPLRSAWAPLCPGGKLMTTTCSSNVIDLNWFPARFGHIIRTVGTSTVLIYGGLGCKTYSQVTVNTKVESRCTELGPLNDLWEFNVLKALAGQQPLSLLETSPSMQGLAGISMSIVPNADNRVLTFGGSTVMHIQTLMLQRLPVAVDGAFQIRNIEFRSRKAARTDLALPELSSHSYVQNSTHVILFGGFIGNALTSAAFVYEIAAASPALGFGVGSILSLQAPQGRSYPGLVKPDSTTMVMFGGLKDGLGRSDLWKLDVVSSSWTRIAKEDTTNPFIPPPAAFNAFSYFYVDSSLVFMSWGGLLGGYKSGISFAGADSQDQEFSVTNSGYYMMWNSDAPVSVWSKVMTKNPVQCCNPTTKPNPDNENFVKCEAAGYWGPHGCQPQSRAMQSVTFGIFVAGQSSLLLYGGVDYEGKALADLWYIDIGGDTNMGFTFGLIFQGLPSAFDWSQLDLLDQAAILSDLKTILVSLIMHNSVEILSIPPANRTWFPYDQPITSADMDIYSTDYYGGAADYFPNSFIFKTRRPEYCHILFNVNLVQTAWIEAVYRTQSSLKSNIFNNVTLDCTDPRLDDPQLCLVTKWEQVMPDMGFEFTKYDDLASCMPADGAKCMRGICMGATSNTLGLVTRDKYADVQYCYAQTGAQATTECTITTMTEIDGDGETTTLATTDYKCSLPGARHGHGALSFTLLGKMVTYLVFGGEQTSLKPEAAGSISSLTNDVHTLHFTPTTVTWIKLWTSCDDPTFGSKATCPEKRRDSALSIMGNNGGENGRLIIFGGIGGASEDPTSSLFYNHGIKSYLDRAVGTINVKIFDDLWYLDLSNLDESCVADGLCTKSLTWHKVDVTGSRPGTGFGAGVLLDPSENLYIIGGADNTFEERDELYVFKLRDPFYKYCSATGGSLTSARAGERSVFYLQCLDNFMRPADGASFTVDISGPVGMIPGIVSLGEGKYSCSFTPVKVGLYSLSIYVGRGGSKFQDLITGFDLEPSNNVLDGEFAKQCTYNDQGVVACKTSQNPYSLTVVPGPTSPAVTTALGTYLTLSTAGIAAEFVITSKDDFANRRPGGDTISVLMGLWACNGVNVDDVTGANDCLRVGAMSFPDKTPQTGTVTDNSDGSYSTAYLITAAGQYSMTIGLSGTNGANSPFILTVVTDVADKSLTYVYGNLKGIAAGVPSELYVQTRDKYGNAIRASIDLFPIGEINGGTEDIRFEVCKSVGSTQGDNKCAGGEQYTAVGVTISYSIGPDGKHIDPETHEPYWGLYQIIFFPFEAEPVLPRVLHGNKVEDGETADTATVVQCYFDTTGSSALRSQMDPGAAAANTCISEASAAAAQSRRGLSHEQPFPLIRISAPTNYPTNSFTNSAVRKDEGGGGGGPCGPKSTWEES